MSNEMGLVLEGGGGKGAFQIGAWKALEKCNILNRITAISGTSVGALNAVLYALNDFENAKKIWLSIDSKTVLSPEFEKNGLFSRDGLIHIIESLPLERLYDSRLKVYINVFNKDENKVDTYLLNTLPKSDIKTLLLASSAMPILYDEVVYNGIHYEDGGVTQYGNVNIEPLYDKGYRNIVLVSLRNDFNLYKVNIYKDHQIKKNINLQSYYPDMNIEIIKPLEDIGGHIKGTLNFTHSSAIEKMIDGYMATRFIYEGEIITMKNKYSKINILIESKMKKLFRNEKELEDFVRITNFSNVNIMMPTMGGTVWYENVVELFGWKVQQHKLGGLKQHYRILDQKGIRRAWILDPEDLLNALSEYEATRDMNIV